VYVCAPPSSQQQSNPTFSFGVVGATNLEMPVGEIAAVSHEAAATMVVWGTGAAIAGAAGYGIGTGINWLCGECYGSIGGVVYELSHPYEPNAPTPRPPPPANCGNGGLIMPCDD
jgi:hypothetical protein